MFGVDNNSIENHQLPKIKEKTITIRILQTLSLLVSAEEQTSTLYNQ